jgi:predicted chitinase
MAIKGTDVQVQLIDPNNVNVNNSADFPNGIAQYQDMFIFAELTAKRKGRTVLTVNEDVTNEKYVKVNFIGNNQNTDDNDPDRLNFTTNYYQGSHSGSEQFESFGMTSIKVSVNSSYVPQVSIQFVDIRGLSFFNQTDSKYRIIFDFPPPIFTLTIKGYYGKSLTYDLHLVKYTTEFKAENGNFVIDAQFVGMTFAPLTDVLFRYIVNAPLIKWNRAAASPNVGEPPENTNDFILKLQSLYSAINREAHNNEDNGEYKKITERLIANDNVMTMLENYDTFLNSNGYSSYMFTVLYDNKIKRLNSLGEYDDLRTSITTNNQNAPLSKLYIGYIETSGNESVIRPLIENYKKSLIDNANINNAIETSLTNGDITGPNVVSVNENISTTPATVTKDFIHYCVVDLTEYYRKLSSSKINFTQKKEELSQKITTAINSTIKNHLGFEPTIYNVFELLCDDVDEFFRIIRKTSLDAENHHEKFKADFIAEGGGNGTMQDNEMTIFSFPLFIEKQKNKNIDYQVRIAPIEFSKKLEISKGEAMPEMTLVYDFIDSFVKQKKIRQLNDIREQKLEDGRNAWFPITPIDSELANTDVDSPYIGLGSPNQIYDILLNRFYMLSEYAIPTKFYKDSQYDYFFTNETLTSEGYIDLYSKTEAMNVIISQGSDKLISTLQTDSQISYNNIENFYKYLSGSSEIKNFKFSDQSVKSIDKAYINILDPNYVGMSLYYGDVPLLSEATPSLLTEFGKSLQPTFVQKLYKDKMPEGGYQFTNENLIYMTDSYTVENNTKAPDSDDIAAFDGINITTRFATSVGSVNKLLITKSTSDVIDIVSKGGNLSISDISPVDWIIDFTKSMIDSKFNLTNFTNVIDIWVDTLSRSDDAIYNDVINISTDEDKKIVSQIVFLSNFGLTLSPYNAYPKHINYNVFGNPAVIEIPYFLGAYIGAVIYMKEHQDIYNKVVDFFVKHSPDAGAKGQVGDIDSRGLYLFADYYDINTYMSVNDKSLFSNIFDDFSTIHNNMLQGLNKAYAEAKSASSAKNITKEEKVKIKKGVYNTLLNPIPDSIASKQFVAVFGEFLLHDTKIVLFSEGGFKYYNTPSTRQYFYKSLSTLLKDKNKKQYIDRFFNGFFTAINADAADYFKKKIDEETEQKKLTGDKDIVSQMYYSFKNINDKWLTYPSRDFSASDGGYPYAPAGKRLIDSFAFVDRTMNDIGDTIINPEILIQLFNDTDVNVYSVMSQLLSLNGFLFFPLQNFMNHTPESWNDTFKITPNVGFNTVASFICMYAGGSSSYPSNINIRNSGFKDDGMDSVEDLAIGGNVGDESAAAEDPASPWRKVKAFNVKFGQQNQSMFTNIKIDSKEFPETNESIQILARLAGDEKNNAPVQKGQNLYNLYENRAYKATITGLGNAMIQPTQYFQLDNIPLYNGAYLILGVEHNITANKMTTQFSGTKILRFPVPRIISAAAVMGYGGDAAQNAVAAAQNAVAAATNVTNAKAGGKLNVPQDKVVAVSNALKRAGVTNKHTVASIVAIGYKESGLVSKSEGSYKKTGNNSIRKIFGKRVVDLTDTELSTLKLNDVKFFDRVYGLDDPTGRGRDYGNTAVGDGYKYRGRGLNQLTFKSNYQTYAKLTGYDIVTYPEKLNEPDVAYAVLSSYFLSIFKSHIKIMKSRYGVDNINGFTDINTAYEAMYNINAGIGNDTRVSDDATGGKAVGRKAADDVYPLLA